MSQEIRDKISKMDVKSDEFFEIYKLVSDKYWTFEKPDMLQSSAAMLVKFAEKGDAAQITIAAKVVVELFNMEKEKKTNCKMTFQKDDGHDFVVDIYQDGIEKEKLETMLEKAAISMKSGNFTIKGKRK